jgi:lipopolysaccharide export LptBFGC system permease protein LptF/metal-sulfur cluster biosynthetic enzyme
MFRTLDRYLIREIVPYVLLGLMLLTAIIFAQEASRFSELLVVASRNGLPMETLWRVMSALIPGILVFTLPISLLIGTLVGLGRLSGDSEIVALGASGTSRLRMLAPVLGLSLIIAALMVYITFNLMPRSIHNLTDLKANRSLIFQGLNAEIKPRVFEESIPQRVLYIEDIDRANSLWRNIFLVDLGNGSGQMKIVTATSGSLRQGERSEMPELHLERGALHQTDTGRPNPNESTNQPEEATSDTPTTDTHSTSASQFPPEKQGEKVKKKGDQLPPYTAARFDEMTFGLEVSEDRKGDASGIEREARQVEEMEWDALIAHTPAESDAREWLAEVHKRVALPAACLVFGLLGVGFGITNVRTGRSFGLLLGLAITIVFYLLALWGQHAAVAGTLPVWLGIWLANIVLGALGVAIIVAQRRPGWDPLAVLSSLRHIWPGSKEDGEKGRRGDGAKGRQGDAGVAPSPSLPLPPSPPLPLTQSPAPAVGGGVNLSEDLVREELKKVIDPELFINIVDLGLIYNVDLVPAAEGKTTCKIDMTMTSPMCPAGPQLIANSKQVLGALNGMGDVEIKIVLDPPWTPDKMTQEARDQLGIF